MLVKNCLRVLLKVENGYQRRHAGHIAFIGLGNMGTRMTANLIKKGQKLKVYDVIPTLTSSISGATPCKSPEEAVDGAKIVITMLPDSKIVKEVVLGEKGILKKMPKNAFLLDSSTVGPQLAREIFAAAKDYNVKFLDAPVSGGILGAEAATLTFMVGGNKTDVAEVEPVLLQMGAKVFHCGDAGAGQVAKLCNNLIFGITMIGTSEALNLGIKLGLDAKLLTDIINISTGRSFSSDTYNPVAGLTPNAPSNRNYEGGFLVKLIAKDMGLAGDCACDISLPVPLTALSHQIYRTMMQHGLGDKDFSVVYKFLDGKK